jgi:hypothetical protein
MGGFGDVDPSTNLLNSYDTGQQQVGQPGFPYWEFWFQLNGRFEPKIEGSILSTSATINVMADEHSIVGPLVGPLRPLSTGRYFVKVSGHATFHFGFIAVPLLSSFPNDAGRTPQSARNLGTFSYPNGVGHKNSFYTFFPRAQITPSSGPGHLVPDFSHPTPFAPSPDWYSFNLPKRQRVRLQAAGSIPGPTYVLTLPNGSYALFPTGHTLELDPGLYLLAVYDQKTRVSGGDNIVTYRDPNAENFEHYSFDIVVSA